MVTFSRHCINVNSLSDTLHGLHLQTFLQLCNMVIMLEISSDTSQNILRDTFAQDTFAQEMQFRFWFSILQKDNVIVQNDLFLHSKRGDLDAALRHGINSEYVNCNHNLNYGFKPS